MAMAPRKGPPNYPLRNLINGVAETCKLQNEAFKSGLKSFLDAPVTDNLFRNPTVANDRDATRHHDAEQRHELREGINVMLGSTKNTTRRSYRTTDSVVAPSVASMHSGRGASTVPTAMPSRKYTSRTERFRADYISPISVPAGSPVSAPTSPSFSWGVAAGAAPTTPGGASTVSRAATTPGQGYHRTYDADVYYAAPSISRQQQPTSYKKASSSRRLDKLGSLAREDRQASLRDAVPLPHPSSSHGVVHLPPLKSPSMPRTTHTYSAVPPSLPAIHPSRPRRSSNSSSNGGSMHGYHSSHTYPATTVQPSPRRESSYGEVRYDRDPTPERMPVPSSSQRRDYASEHGEGYSYSRHAGDYSDDYGYDYEATLRSQPQPQAAPARQPSRPRGSSGGGSSAYEEDRFAMYKQAPSARGSSGAHSGGGSRRWSNRASEPGESYSASAAYAVPSRGRGYY